MHYYINNHEDDTTSYLASAIRLERFVDTLEGILRYVKAKQRSKHDVYLSWDEWQIWNSIGGPIRITSYNVCYTKLLRAQRSSSISTLQACGADSQTANRN